MVSEESKNGVIFGRNSVLEALKGSRNIDKIYVLRGNRTGSLISIVAKAKEKRIPVIEADEKKLEQMCGDSHHQGVIAFVNELKYSTVKEIVESAVSKDEKPFVVILDGVTDPHNLGAIIRTCDACGVHGLILPKRNSSSITPVVFKAACGACEHVKIARVSNITDAIRELKDNNVWIYSAEGGASYAKDVFETDFSGGVALVLGDEGKGISRLVLDESDFLVSIPMLGHINSLNVSVAAGVIMYEITRQRRQR